MKRSRGRGRRPQNNQNSNNPNRTYDSTGPEVKIRGSASHVYEKYQQLARDANASGDRIMAENYLQHAEHYFRIMAAAQAHQQQFQQANGAGNGKTAANGNGAAAEANGAPAAGSSAPSFSLAEGEEEGETVQE